MPGPVSDSFDPEWGTGENGQLIRDALAELYKTLSAALEDEPPIYILDLVKQREARSEEYALRLTEWELRIIRFAVERAEESI